MASIMDLTSFDSTNKNTNAMASERPSGSDDDAADFGAARVWPVGALCRAIADALAARFNPVQVRGEIAGFTRAASGHCYFSLKDRQGQLRCAMFKRAADGLLFSPREGDLVEVTGRLGVYEPRGDLQLIVERLQKAGQGALFEAFLRLKEKLQAEGLFDTERKRPLPLMPRRIGLVTSLGAAALHDVATALARRVPHLEVVLVNAAVQGAQAPAELVKALQALYAAHGDPEPGAAKVDVILLVRGGGSMEDLWAFNDEQLARTLLQSPVPVICGVGHETDFTIADFVADVRAPTPTAAAELVAQPQAIWLGALDLLEGRLADALTSQLDACAQRLDWVASRLGRPSSRANEARWALQNLEQRLQKGVRQACQKQQNKTDQASQRWIQVWQDQQRQQRDRLDRLGLQLDLMNPDLVLKRGYALLTQENGQPITQVKQVKSGQSIQARLADGQLDLTVR
jgi:exodeoxyribonuclease VII large subunit